MLSPAVTVEAAGAVTVMTKLFCGGRVDVHDGGPVDGAVGGMLTTLLLTRYLMPVLYSFYGHREPPASSPSGRAQTSAGRIRASHAGSSCSPVASGCGGV